MKIFRVGSRQFRESLRELLRELWVSYRSSRERPFREWNFVFRELNFKFRELLREYPGTLPELREWPFHSESVFPEIGVVPRLLNKASEGKSLGRRPKVLRRTPLGILWPIGSVPLMHGSTIGGGKSVLPPEVPRGLQHVCAELSFAQRTPARWNRATNAEGCRNPCVKTFKGGMSAERNCPRKKNPIDAKSGLKNAQHTRKTIRNLSENIKAPLTALQKFSPALFSKFFAAQNLHKIFVFLPQGSAGVATLSHNGPWKIGML